MQWLWSWAPQEGEGWAVHRQLMFRCLPVFRELQSVLLSAPAAVLGAGILIPARPWPGEGHFALRSSGFYPARARHKGNECPWQKTGWCQDWILLNTYFLLTLMDYLLPGRASLWLTQAFTLVTVRKMELQESLIGRGHRAMPCACRRKKSKYVQRSCCSWTCCDWKGERMKLGYQTVQNI